METQTTWPSRLAQSIATEVRRHRKGRKLSAQQVSDECSKLGVDLPRSTLADLENGRRAALSVAELIALARVLDVPPLLLLFPVDQREECEVLPGEHRAPFRAAQWFAGEAKFPGPDDAALLTVLNPWNAGSAAPLTLYRAHDRAADDELSAMSRAADLDRRAAAAITDEDRTVFTVAAAAERRAAESARETGDRLRDEAKARGWLAPPLTMSVVIPQTDA